MFTSTKDIMMLDCGHWIHKDCYEEYSKNDYRCPSCKKSMGNMKQCWKKMSDYINQLKIPKEFNTTKCIITCNDCLKKSIVNFSILHKCPLCNSWNTFLNEIVNEN